MAPLSIAAIVVSHSAGDYLERSLRDLENQNYPIEQVVVVDTAGDETALELAKRHNFAAIQPGDLRLGAAIQAGISALASRPNWIWILHDDSAPEADALRHLAKAAEISPSVAIIGPKLLDWNHPIEIQQMGLTITSTGRPFLQVEREYDQGQHDGSADTLAVSTAGMLISLGLWEKLGGLDDQTPVFAQDIELGLRARAAGFRVIIEATARVHHAGLAMQGERPRKWVGGSRRQGLSKAHLHLATTILPLPAILLVYLLLPFIAIASVPWNLFNKNPGRSLGQITGWLWAWFTLPRRISARLRTRRLGQLTGARGLFASTEQQRKRRRRELVLEVEPKDPVRGLFSSGAILLTLIPLVLSLTRFPQGAIVTDNLPPIGRSFADIWNSVSADTLSYLNGLPGTSDPFNWFYAALALIWPQQPSLALAGFVFLAPSLVFVGSWLLLGVVSKRPWVRSAIAMAIALSPQLQSAAGNAAVVELAAFVGFVWSAYFISKSFSAFNSARSWRWMALAAFAGALVAIASPLVFLLLLLTAIWLGVVRPARYGIVLWFAIPGLALLFPFVEVGSFDFLVTSAARTAFDTQSVYALVAMGVLALGLALGFAVGRSLLLLGLVLSSALIVGLTRIDLLNFGELWLLLMLALGLGAAEFLDRLPRRGSLFGIGVVTSAALASGVFFGPLAELGFQRTADRQLPALVVALADVDPGTRTLVIEFGEQTAVDFIWGEGRGAEDIATGYLANPTQSGFRDLLAQLAGSLIAGNPDGVSELVQATSTDFVLLTGDQASVSAAAISVESTALFQASGDTDFGVLFRSLSVNSNPVEVSHPQRNYQLWVLIAYVLLALPTPATIRGYRKVRGRA